MERSRATNKLMDRRINELLVALVIESLKAALAMLGGNK